MAFQLHVQLSNDYRDKLAKADDKYNKQLLGRVFEMWNQYAQDSKALQWKITTAVAAMHRRHLQSVLCAWQAAVQLSKNKKANQQRALLCMMNSTQRRALAAWKGYMQSRVQKQDQVAKALAHSTRGVLHRALAGWQEYCSSAHHKREKMLTATASLRRCMLAKVSPSQVHPHRVGRITTTVCLLLTPRRYATAVMPLFIIVLERCCTVSCCTELFVVTVSGTSN